jgi:hypothetical protein
MTSTNQPTNQPLYSSRTTCSTQDRRGCVNSEGFAINCNRSHLRRRGNSEAKCRDGPRREPLNRPTATNTKIHRHGWRGRNASQDHRLTMPKTKRSIQSGESRALSGRRTSGVSQYLNVKRWLPTTPRQTARTQTTSTWLRNSSSLEEKSDVEMICTEKSSRELRQSSVPLSRRFDRSFRP